MPSLSPVFSLDQLRARLAAQDARAAHIDRIWRAWLQARPLDAGPRNQPAERCLPQKIRRILPEIAAHLQALAQVRSEHPAADGAVRLLVALADKRTIESVLLPRDGVCVSTQAGCAVGCVFCMTGQGGLLRQLESSEILAQVVLARARRPIRRVVFMGMGEPAHNLDHVLEAIRLLGTLGGIGHKNLVVSSVGDPRLFERLCQETVRPALALSLHSARFETRAALLPKAAAMTPEELVAAGARYARFSGHPIQYQWTLLAGVNDGDDEIEGMIRLLRGQYAMMNLIPCNAATAACERPAMERVRHIAFCLNREGILTRIRHSAAQEVEGGCGQLRARMEG